MAGQAWRRRSARKITTIGCGGECSSGADDGKELDNRSPGTGYRTAVRRMAGRELSLYIRRAASRAGRRAFDRRYPPHPAADVRQRPAGCLCVTYPASCRAHEGRDAIVKQLAPLGCIGMVIFIVLALVGAPFAASGPPMYEGTIMQLQLGSTLWGITQCLREAGSTRIFLDELHQAYLFAWPVMDGWGFALSGGTPELVSQMLKSGGEFSHARKKGQFMQTAKKVGKWRKEKKNVGWTIVPASAVPAHIKVIVAGAATAQGLYATFTTFIVLPAGVTFDLLEQYQQFEGGGEIG